MVLGANTQLTLCNAGPRAGSPASGFPAEGGSCTLYGYTRYSSLLLALVFPLVRGGVILSVASAGCCMTGAFCRRHAGMRPIGWQWNTTFIRLER